MRKKNWLAWLLIAAMVANHTSVAFAAADNSGSAGIEVSLQKATVSDADSEDLASASDAEEEDPFADRDLIDDVTENESVTADPDDEELATVSDADMVLGEDLKEEIILTDAYEVPWVNLVDIPDQFAAVTYALDNTEETVYFPEEGQGSELAGYFGSQMTRQKAFDIYDTMWNYYDQVLHGDYEPTQTGVIPYGTGEDGAIWTSEGTKEELSLVMSSLKVEIGSYMQQAFYAFLYDYPEMFWEFTPTVKFQMPMSSYDGITWTGTVTMKLEFKASESKTEVQSMAAELENAVDAITSQCNPQDMSPYEMLKTAHDAIAAGASYDKTLKRTYAHSPYGVLVEGLGVCESYAKALKWVCDDLDILNVLIVGIGNTSDGSGNHMWNYVQMNDDRWYAVDLTWDDQDSGIRDEYFLVGAESLGFDGERFIDSHEEQYISVMNGVAEGTEYFMYPNLEDQAYDQSGIDNVVNIPDANLKQALLDHAFDTDGDGELSISEMEAITSLEGGILENKGIVSLTGLEYAVNLTVVTLNGNEGLDIQPLSLLPNLETVRLNRTGIRDFSALKELPKLKRLNAVGNGITSADLEVLKEFPALRKVNLSSNNIEDVTAISALNLNEIDLSGNPVAVIPDEVRWAAGVFFSVDNEGVPVPNRVFSGSSLKADDLNQSKFVNAADFSEDQWNAWIEANTSSFVPVTKPEWSAEYPGWAHFTGANGAVDSIVLVYEDGTLVGEITGDKTWADLRELIYSGKSYTYRAASRLVKGAVFDESSMHLLSEESVAFEAPLDVAELPAVTDLAFEGDGVMSWTAIGDKPYTDDFGKLYAVYVYDGNAADGDPYIESFKTDETSMMTTNPSSQSGTLKFRVRVLGDYIQYGNSELSGFSPVWPEQSVDGWQQSEDGNWYYYQNGELLTNQLLELEDGTYYLQESGARLTGWKEWEDDRWSYFNSEGKMRRSNSFTLKKIEGSYYAFDADGYMLTGWVSSAENKALTDPYGWQMADYYFDEADGKNYGALVTGWQLLNVYDGWKTEDYADYWFFFKRDSTAANYGVKKIGWREETKTDGTTKKYYLDETGAMREGLTEVDGVLYYFDPADGHMLTNTEVTVDGVKYVIDENGAATIQIYEVEIISQPQDVWCEAGTAVAFTVEAKGEELEYQWEYSKDGENTWITPAVSSSRTATYKISPTANSMNGRAVRCIITDPYGNILISNTATLNIITRISIINQPQNIECEPGEAAVFTVSAEGKGLAYQWEYSKDGGATWITPAGSTAKTAAYTITPTIKSMSGRVVRCTITDTNGNTAVSDTAVLTVANRISIINQPQNISCEPGAGATFTVTVEGDGLTYQWEYSKDGGATWITPAGSTAKTAAYTITPTIKSMNGRVVRCTIVDVNGNTAVSDTAVLTVASKLSITGQPQNMECEAGDGVTFMIAADGDGLTYQWEYSKDNGATWTTPAGSTAKTAAYTITPTIKSMNGRMVRCTITDANGNTVVSETAVLTVTAKLAITGQPQNVESEIGAAVAFTITAAGNDLIYQWEYSRDGGATWTTPGVSSAKTATYRISPVAKSMNGRLVRCTVTDGNGNTLLSDTAVLTLK